MKGEIEWIPVTERMPPVSVSPDDPPRDNVLAAWHDDRGWPRVSEAYYDPEIIDTIDETGWWTDDMSVLTNVTHWAHLPPHPDP